MRHHKHSDRLPPIGTVQRGSIPLDKIIKELRKDKIVATPADLDPHRRRATVGPDAPVRHAEPDLELDADAIEEVATPVAESLREVPPPLPGERGVVRVGDRHHDVDDIVLELMEKVDILTEDVRKLKRRMTEHTHNASPQSSRIAEENQRFVDFINMLPAGLKVTTSMVAANVDLGGKAETRSSRTGNRLRTLAEQGVIGGAKQEHSEWMFWSLKEST